MPVPTGLKLDDGFSTVILFQLDQTLGLWEKRVKPPGLDGGGPNNTTTMRNLVYRTQSPKKLITLTAMTARCAYDPQHFNRLVSILNKNQQITVTYPDGGTLTFYGWLDKFDPDELIEGAQPEAMVTIEPSNQVTPGGAEATVTLTARTTTTTTTSTTTTT